MDSPCKPCAKFTLVPLFNFLIICLFIFIIVTSILFWVFFAQNGVLNKTIEIDADFVIPFSNKAYQNYTFLQNNSVTPGHNIYLPSNKNSSQQVTYSFYNQFEYIINLPQDGSITIPHTDGIQPSLLFPLTVLGNKRTIIETTKYKDLKIITSVKFVNYLYSPPWVQSFF
jgi:hypothetical protein